MNCITEYFQPKTHCRATILLSILALPSSPLLANPSWQYESYDDPCERYDIVLSRGTDIPDPTRCNANTIGMIAVCWDGNRVVNKYEPGAFCTYKARECETQGQKGVSPGNVYRCR